LKSRQYKAKPPTLLVSFDLSAAVNSLGHAILLYGLKISFDFDGPVCNWIESRSSLATTLLPQLISPMALPRVLLLVLPCRQLYLHCSFSLVHLSMLTTHYIASLFLSQLTWSNKHAIRYPLIHTNLFSVHVTRQRSPAFTDIASVNIAGPVVPPANQVKLLGVKINNRL